MVDLKSIPKAALEKLTDCTTADDVIELAQQYDIEITQEEAEAALAAGGKDLESLASGGCKEDDGIDTCGDCKYFNYLPKQHIYLCTIDRYDNVPVYPKKEPCLKFEKG